MRGWVNATEIPAGVPLTLNTGTINILLPGISDYYGPSQPVDVHFNVTSLGNFQVFEANSKMSGTTSLNLQFWVEKADATKELACELNLSDMDFDFSALVTDMNITLNITKINIDQVQVVSDTFGKLSALTLKLKLNNGFRIMLPLLNVFLSKFDVQIPSNIFGIFELSNLNLDYFDGYIYAGATPTFLPPSTEHATGFIQ